MRFRVDLPYGYISLDSKDEERAWEIFNDPSYSAVRIRRCNDIHDEGVVLAGQPIMEDLTRRYDAN